MSYRRSVYSFFVLAVIVVAAVSGTSPAVSAADDESSLSSSAQGSQFADQSPDAILGTIDYANWVGYLARSSQKFTGVTTEFQVPHFSCAHIKQDTSSKWWAGLVGYKKGQIFSLQQAGVEADCAPKPRIFAVYEAFPASPHKLPFNISFGDWIKVVITYIPDKQAFIYNVADLTNHHDGGGGGACGAKGYCTREGAAVIEERTAYPKGNGYFPLVTSDMAFADNTTTGSSQSPPQALGHDAKVYAVDMTKTSKPSSPVLYVSGPFSKDGKRFGVGPY